MKYTFTINDESLKAKRIINMLRELKKDYDFIETSGEPVFDESHPLVAKELLFRQNQTLKNKEGKNWEQLLDEL